MFYVSAAAHYILNSRSYPNDIGLIKPINLLRGICIVRIKLAPFFFINWRNEYVSLNRQSMSQKLFCEFLLVAGCINAINIIVHSRTK